MKHYTQIYINVFTAENWCLMTQKQWLNALNANVFLS